MDWERISVLVVDDSQFMRMLLGRILRSLNIRQVLMAADGAEAINMLKEIPRNPQKYGVQRIDLVISDWVMSPVDGGMFLRWVRTHRDSPNRFLPFIMMSALSEAEKVMEARDLGANEFLAKPFSISTMATKITSLIQKQRHFIMSASYFGPDRRRQQVAISKANRRTITKEEIEVVHSGKIPAVLKPGIKVSYLKVPNRLHDLVAGLSDGTAEIKFDDALLEEAENTLQAMEADYADLVRDMVLKLRKAYQILTQKPKNYWKYFTIINEIAHDLRGQGETFGYPIVSMFGKSLYEYTKINVSPDDRFIELIHSHIEAIQAIVREKIKGDGGDVGKAVVQMLEGAKQKYDQRQQTV